MSNKINKNLIKEINDAWLDINVDSKYIINPLTILRTEDPDEFHMRFTWLLMQPDYFSFICKHILNIDILPMQALMLKEMWNRKFPMLVGSRGLGKAVKPTEKIRIKNGWKMIKDINVGDKVYGSDGKLCNVTYKTDLQKDLVMYKITLRDGRTIDCCEDHMWKVWDKNKNRKPGDIVWSELKTKDLIDNYFWVRKDSKAKSPKLTKEFRYALPINAPIQEDDHKDFEIHPYIVGVLLGDGCLTQNQITISSLDKEVIDNVECLLPRGYTLRTSNKQDYRIVRSDKSVVPFHHLCRDIGIWGYNSHTKFIPNQYKNTGYENSLHLLQGLMDTDGWASKHGVIEYYSVSEKLHKDSLDLIRSLGISCKSSVKEAWFDGNRYADCYRVSLYTDKPVFKLSRKLKYLSHVKSKAGLSKYEKVFITNIERIDNSDGYCIQVDSPDHTYITENYIVTHNTFILSLYCMLRALFLPGRKIVVVGAAFRQSKFLHDYMENIWKNSPILRDMCDNNSGPRRDVDMCRMTLNGSVISALPIGDGSKIRGQRANDIVADEFASMSRDIFENVIAGFAAVSASPAENVKRLAAETKAKELGVEIGDLKSGAEDFIDKGNQIILSGTAFYAFNHFAEYWNRWRTIINTKGDPHRIKSEVFNGEEPPSSFNWRDYSVMRIPVDLVPKGFMDDGQIARSKATVHNGIYLMEFGSCFAKDSQGFFKRSLIESCVGGDQTPVKLKSGDVYFDPLLKGELSKRYVMGVDPASEVDNFSIIILELHEDHRRVVHCWTTTRKDHVSRVKRGLTSEDNFYSYCARKIRELMNLFPICHIALDAQGGGIAVAEALHDTNQLLKGETPIWPIIDEDSPQSSDDEHGMHILEMCQFARYEWYSEANHGLRKDFEDKALIFPRFDPVTIGLSIEQDKANNRLYDTLEDCVMEIEELKNELSLIEITQTANGRDRWNTPEVKTGVGRKKSMRKDRYSSLLMANMASRLIASEVKQSPYVSYGGFASTDTAKNSGPAFTAPNWFNDGVKGVY
jgi:hypothetical protein